MKQGNIVLAVISIFLFLSIMFYANYLGTNNYVEFAAKEAFTTDEFLTPTPEAYKPHDTYYSRSTNYSNDASTGYTHTISMPINKTTDCSNKCQPGTARCTITGQQCATDYDCPGCYRKVKGKSTYTPPVPAANDAGKLTPGLALNYSPLTFGYGTRNETIVPPTKENPDNNKYAMYGKGTLQADFGVNTWQQQFLQENDFYKQRYSLPSALHYRPLETTTGQFVTDDPLPSNF